MTFPRHIHFIWYQGIESAPAEIRNNPVEWGRMNPGWRINFWDSGALTRFIRSHYKAYWPAWEALPSVIKKCDFARVLILFHFGGVYADMDLKPFRPLDDFLNAGEVRHRKTFVTGKLPAHDNLEQVALLERDIILTREYRQVPGVGWPVANGIIISKRHLRLWHDFLDSRIHEPWATVLNYVGPWALSRFIKANAATLQGKVTVLPPYYFLWEPYHFKQARPAWVVSEHQAKNYWGDHSKPDWWNTH